MYDVYRMTPDGTETRVRTFDTKAVANRIKDDLTVTALVNGTGDTFTVRRRTA